MSETVDLLQASRSAHQQAKNALRTGDTAKARECFREALTYRLKARAGDPDRMDASWRNDAIHPKMPGESQRRHLRMPGMTTAEVAAKLDADLERYFREQLGEIDRAVIVVEHPEIVTPKQWVMTVEGALDEDGRTTCKEGHRMQLLNFDQRVCVCGRIETLTETVALEDTEAFKAALAEGKTPATFNSN